MPDIWSESYLEEFVEKYLHQIFPNTSAQSLWVYVVETIVSLISKWSN